MKVSTKDGEGFYQRRMEWSETILWDVLRNIRIVALSIKQQWRKFVAWFGNAFGLALKEITPTHTLLWT